MGRITKIVSQKGYKNGCIVYLDDGTSFSLHIELLVKYGLTEGSEVDVQQVRKWFEEDGVKYAYNAALRYLGFRSRSRKEIEDYLKRKGFEDNTIFFIVIAILFAGYTYLLINCGIDFPCRAIIPFRKRFFIFLWKATYRN
jgi:regulatory protein